MKGHPEIIATVQAAMLSELTAIDQYTAHKAYVEAWGYAGLAAYYQERIVDETRHFNLWRRWLIILGAEPFTASLGRVNVSKDPRGMFLFDRTAEELAIAGYNDLAALCILHKDFRTFEQVQLVLHDESEHLIDIDAQLTQIEQMTLQNYLSTKLV